MLLAARGRSNTRIAAQTRMHVDRVRSWRGRFAADLLARLDRHTPADRREESSVALAA
ncbi:hypothetical protein [Streptomyces venezuelae]|uniref:hypothetical protein n=1 Tax=Streptomyces venezuelae TaxID=54571 RepID=UPI003EBAF22C